MALPDTNATIVAQATPPGAGALAVVRLSGPSAVQTASLFLSPFPVEHAMARLASVLDGERLVDRAVVLFYRSPRSYTGEDTVEITCHGSPYVVRTVLSLAVRNGARPAEPGEFTLRAFLNGKLDLTQAEAIGQLIEAGSEAAHRAAITQAEGLLSAKVREMRGELVPLMADLEARLDDSYEELPPLDGRDFLRRAAEVRESAESLAADYETGKGIRDGLNVVIAGAPNSGKSSLFNALLGYDRAMVSGTAGTTRDTLEARLEIDGFTVLLTDTAGLNAGRPSPLEREGIRRAGEAIAKAGAVILVKDASTPESPADRLAEREVQRLSGAGTRIVRVHSKSDLPEKRRAAGARHLAVSARTGAGLPALRATLIAEQKKVFRDGTQAVITSARHFSALSAAARELRALEAVVSKRCPALELAAEHLRAASNALAGLLGETAPEEVLADIFGRFCVGK